MRIPMQMMRVAPVFLSALVTGRAFASDINPPVSDVVKSLGINGSSIPWQSSGPSLACAILRLWQPGQVVYPSDATSYANETQDYWSAVAYNTPVCVFSPKGSLHVAGAVAIFRATNATFATKGGGHMPFAGFAGTNSGVLMRTRDISGLSYDANKRTLTVGMGNTWGSVYAFAGKYGMTVVGGRVSDVGTGLVLGGGLSHLSYQNGMVADNILSYELVTADGHVRTASPTSNPDLYFALKGGGNNFGIVTSVVMKAYPIGKVWGGLIAYNNTYRDQVMSAIAQYQTHGQSDTKSAILSDLVITYDELLVNLVYLAPVQRPAAFDPFFSIPAMYDLTRLHDNFTDLIGGPVNKQGIPRWSWGTTTMLLDEASLVDAARICQDQAAETLAGIPGGNLVLNPQPIPADLIRSNSSNGNPLNITPKKQNWFSFSVGWLYPADDAKIDPFIIKTISKIEAMTKSRGIYDGFVFLNDAHSSQRPFQSYGSENYKRLQATAKKYDPQGLFQTQSPGGFKLFT